MRREEYKETYQEIREAMSRAKRMLIGAGVGAGAGALAYGIHRYLEKRRGKRSENYHKTYDKKIGKLNIHGEKRGRVKVAPGMYHKTSYHGVKATYGKSFSDQLHSNVSGALQLGGMYGRAMSSNDMKKRRYGVGIRY